MRWVYLIERYRSVTNIAGTVVVGWVLSALVCQIIGLFLPDASPTVSAAIPATSVVQGVFDPTGQERKLEYYMPICDRNIFDSQKRSPCTTEVVEGGAQKIDMDSPPIKTDLAATLLGTMVSSNPNRSFGTIQLKSGGKSAEPYHIDEEIEGARIYDIQRNKVFFVRNGHREYLEVENLPNIYMSGPPTEIAAAQPGGVRMEGDKAIVSRAKVDDIMRDMNQVIQQARMVPNMGPNNTVDGFRVFAIKPGSIFQELGLKNGDVVQRINGTEINGVDKALPMLQLAGTANSITLDLLRNGTKKTLTIDIR